MQRNSASPSSPDGDIQYKAKPEYSKEIHYDGLVKMAEFNLENSHCGNDEPFNDDNSYGDYFDEQQS